MASVRPLKRRLQPDTTAQSTFQLGQMTWASTPTSRDGGADAVSSAQTISFAPNVTPRTFTAPAPADDDDNTTSPPSALFPDPADAGPSSFIVGAYQPATKRRRKGGSKPKPPSASSTLLSSSRSSSPCPGSDPDSSGTPPVPSVSEPAHIPRPPNAFILFRSSFIRSQHVSAATEGNHGTLSKIVGMLWHALSYEERQVWQAKARRALAEHRKMYPGYSFRPVKEKAPVTKDKEKERSKGVSPAPSSSFAFSAFTKDAPSTSGLSRTTSVGPASSPAGTDAPKRRTRTVGPRDIARCERIATLLARGFKGAALDAAMREFDATRAPEPFTATFEEPLTAQVYEGRSGTSSNVKAMKVEECVRETESRETTKQGQEIQQERHQQGHPVSQLPLRAIRRSSSAPLLDAEATAEGRRQSAFMLAQSPTMLTALGAEQYYLQHRDLQALPMRPHAPAPVRAARKRSASSSPPLRPRALPMHSYMHLQPRASYSSMAFSTPVAAFPPSGQVHAGYTYDFTGQHQQPYALHLDTSFAHSSYQHDSQQQPHTAHPLSRQPTESSFDGTENNSQGSWYSESGIGNTGVTAWDARGFDLDSFSFTNPPGSSSEATCITPTSARPAGESYSPFDSSPLATSSSDEIDYTGMPVLVEPPARHPLAGFAHHSMYTHSHLHQQSHGQGQAQEQGQNHVHTHRPLAIQTSWNSTDFDFEVPSSAVSGSFDYPPSSADGFSENSSAYALPASPCSSDAPPSTGSSGVHTPGEDTFDAWDNLGVNVGVSLDLDVNVGVDGMTSGLAAYLAHASKLAAAAGVDEYGIGACVDGEMGDEMAGCRTGPGPADFNAFAQFVDGLAAAGAGVGVGQQVM